jgi:hypothetical protein
VDHRWSSGAVVAAGWVDGELAEDLSGGGVDDAPVEVVDEHDDGGCVEVAAEAGVVHLAVDPETLPWLTLSWRTR